MSPRDSPSVLLLSKTNDWCKAAQRFVRAHFREVLICEGEHGDPLPVELAAWSGDYLLSFLGPWIVPAEVLSHVSLGRVNFHPAPPEFPGIGCYNFAIYDGATSYGVTAHHMAPLVDSGPIIKVLRFPLLADDTVALLKERSLAYLLTLFYDVVGAIRTAAPLPTSTERWTRKPYTRSELEALCRVLPDMPPDEIERRVRATSFPGAPGPFVEIGGRRFGIEID